MGFGIRDWGLGIEIWHSNWVVGVKIAIGELSYDLDGDLNLGIEHLDYDWGFGIRNEIWDQD